MITPTFSIEQDETFLTITIHTPHIRAQEIDMFIAGNEFKLYVKPYFLRLHLPGNVVEDERASASYDIAAGTIKARIPKETAGEHFPDLDLLPKLLARQGESPSISQPASTHRRNHAPLIEVLSDDNNDEKKEADVEPCIKEAEAFDWQLPQTLPQTEPVLASYYGFNQQYQGHLRYWTETGNEVNEIEHPEQSTVESRREERVRKENEKFDDDYYIADFMQKQLAQEEGDEGKGEIARLMKYRTRWWDELRKRQKAAKKAANDDGLSDRMEQLSLEKESSTAVDAVDASNDGALAELEYSAEEERWIRELPSKEYLISNEKPIYLGLVDVMFAYSYDHRISEGEWTIESAWTICKLSATLSSLETFTALDQVVLAGFRRALAYPLYRHWELTEKVWTDVYVLFKLGRRALLKVLLAIKQQLDQHDAYHIYSQLYITDYCVWIQRASDAAIRSLAHELHQVKMSKENIGWHLEALEQLALEEEEDEEDETSEEETSEEETSEEETSEEDEENEDEASNKASE
ncbi:SHQ1 protein-domain-containing protein [Syncephalis pseudoplumigaleata]|uniref:SHQ1 protein-domain-containing protein n=1 Tax=Syncephalis pseudoplumigaleata TaxID=1712513 RepID=A0A4P9Z551_9FUNG|nr:SHQ1 protein-domain-containing protein [Syncephalis pseudoplumigaleata]|eukprot:RKP27568.1 SHQ1 protein-domain-containing protein [Syncephalis pseudoplumigaleata]